LGAVAGVELHQQSTDVGLHEPPGGRAPVRQFKARASSTLISGGWQYVAAIALAAPLAAVAVRYRQR